MWYLFQITLYAFICYMFYAHITPNPEDQFGIPGVAYLFTYVITRVLRFVLDIPGLIEHRRNERLYIAQCRQRRAEYAEKLAKHQAALAAPTVVEHSRPFWRRS